MRIEGAENDIRLKPARGLAERPTLKRATADNLSKQHDSFTQDEVLLMQNDALLSPLKDARVRAVVERLHTRSI